jgi:DNA-binding PadR family transcriptional regulator
MSTARLLILSLLANEGPMHGHHLRRRAEMIDVGQWAEVSIGSLYSTLHRLEEEGLIAPLRQERAGNYPARTVYTVTAEGIEEMEMLRAQGLERLQLHADPVDMALASAGGTHETDVRLLLEQRRRAIETRLAYDRAQRERAAASGFISPRARAIIRHWELRLEAELAWHAEIDSMLADLVSARGHPPEPIAEDAEEGDGPTARIVPLPPARNRSARPRGKDAGS